MQAKEAGQIADGTSVDMISYAYETRSVTNKARWNTACSVRNWLESQLATEHCSTRSRVAGLSSQVCPPVPHAVASRQSTFRLLGEPAASHACIQLNHHTQGCVMINMNNIHLRCDTRICKGRCRLRRIRCQESLHLLFSVRTGNVSRTARKQGNVCTGIYIYM